MADASIVAFHFNLYCRDVNESDDVSSACPSQWSRIASESSPGAPDGPARPVSEAAHEPARGRTHGVSVPAEGPVHRATESPLPVESLWAQPTPNILESIWLPTTTMPLDVKYEDVYLHAYDTPASLRAGLTCYFQFYNGRRRHSSLVPRQIRTHRSNRIRAKVGRPARGFVPPTG